MKKYLLFFNLLFFITACDVEEGPFINDYNSYINPEKKVLVEDFTGHLCPNCPDAARELEAIHDIYGDQVIGIAIHVTKSFARPYPASQAPKFQYDFRTIWGYNWDEYYGISEMGLPRGMVNRIGYEDDTHKMGKDQWADAVSLELKKDIDFTIAINANDSIISCTSTSINNIDNNYNIVVCLTENEIINWQKDGTVEVENYIHNHVLRSVITDSPLSSQESFVAGENIENSFPINLSDLEQVNIDYSTNSAELGNGNAGGWNTDNLSVVVYIYNTTTHEIVQVEETKLN